MKKLFFILLGIFIMLGSTTYSFDGREDSLFDTFKENEYVMRYTDDNSSSPNYDMYATVYRKESVDGWLVIYDCKGKGNEAKEYFEKQVKLNSKNPLYTKKIRSKSFISFYDNSRMKTYFIKGDIVGRYEINNKNTPYNTTMELASIEDWIKSKKIPDRTEEKIFNIFKEKGFELKYKNNISYSPKKGMYGTSYNKTEKIDYYSERSQSIVLYDCLGNKELAKQYFKEQIKKYLEDSETYKSTKINENLYIFDSEIEYGFGPYVYFLKGDIVGYYESDFTNKNFSEDVNFIKNYVNTK